MKRFIARIALRLGRKVRIIRTVDNVRIMDVEVIGIGTLKACIAGVNKFAPLPSMDGVITHARWVDGSLGYIINNMIHRKFFMGTKVVETSPYKGTTGKIFTEETQTRGIFSMVSREYYVVHLNSNSFRIFGHNVMFGQQGAEATKGSVIV